MPNRNWFLSILAIAGSFQVALPAAGQALLPYTLQVEVQELE
ncbi:MAG: cytochrome c biogenesis factor, partial [Kamptonema sp. SIO4C4]|nr:cytochrome c biogenesis factor [Kamptonema sp. SIO4C4]